MNLPVLVASALVALAMPAVTTQPSATLTGVRVLLQDTKGQWWSEPITGGTPTLTSYVGSGLFSPDGRHVVSGSHGDGQPRLVVTRTDGTDARVLRDAKAAPVTVLRWSADSTRLLAYAQGGPVAWIDAATGATTKLPVRPDDDIAPDLRLGATAYYADRTVYFSDQRHNLDAGSVRDPANIGFTDPDDQVYGYATWSPTGTQVAVITTQDVRQDGVDASYDSLSLLDLGTRKVSSTADADTISSQFAPDGSAICWVTTDYTHPTDLSQVNDFEAKVTANAAFCAQGSLAKKHKLTAPPGRTIGALAVISTHPAVLDSRHGSISKLVVSSSPSNVDVVTHVNGGDGAGQVVVLTRGNAPATSPTKGLRVRLTEGDHVVLGTLPPSTTFTVTVFPRSWSGRFGAPRSATVRTPALFASTTKVTITSKQKYARPFFATVLVRRSDTNGPLKGAHVTLVGQDVKDDEDTDFGYETEPFHVFARGVTDAHGRLKVKVPAKIDSVLARTSGTSQWSKSSSRDVELAYL